jgi:hypothetical protein
LLISFRRKEGLNPRTVIEMVGCAMAPQIAKSRLQGSAHKAGSRVFDIDVEGGELLAVVGGGLAEVEVRGSRVLADPRGELRRGEGFNVAGFCKGSKTSFGF